MEIFSVNKCRGMYISRTYTYHRLTRNNYIIRTSWNRHNENTEFIFWKMLFCGLLDGPDKCSLSKTLTAHFFLKPTFYVYLGKAIFQMASSIQIPIFFIGCRWYLLDLEKQAYRKRSRYNITVISNSLCKRMGFVRLKEWDLFI